MNITYNDLVARYGKRQSLRALAIIEHSAKVVKSPIVDFDCEARLHAAFRAMHETDLAA